MPSLKLFYGPMLIGVFLNCILYGVLVVQTFMYYQAYKKDATWIRYFILYLICTESVNTFCDIWMMFEPLVMNYGTPRTMTNLPLMLAADPIVTAAISTPIQIFIAWRIRIISGSRWVPAMIVFLSLVSMGGSFWLGAKVVVIKLFARKPELHPPAMIWLVSTAMADVTITFALCLSLAKRKTGFLNTDDAINRIMRLTIQTGMITAIFAVADVVLSLADAHTGLNFTWDFALSKLYSNALLSTLNARNGWGSANADDNVLFGAESTAFNVASNKKLNLSSIGQTTDNSYELRYRSSSAAVKNTDITTLTPSAAAREYEVPIDGAKIRAHDLESR